MKSFLSLSVVYLAHLLQARGAERQPKLTVVCSPKVARAGEQINVTILLSNTNELYPMKINSGWLTRIEPADPALVVSNRGERQQCITLFPGEVFGHESKFSSPKTGAYQVIAWYKNPEGLSIQASDVCSFKE